MARISVIQRMERYALKLEPDRVRDDLEAQKNAMLHAAAVRFEALVHIEDRVKGILAGEPVPTVQYVWYHDFARRVYALKERFLGGQGLQLEVGTEVIVWTRRGANEALLKTISFEVFGVVPG